MHYIYFYERLPKTKLRKIGIEPDFKSYNFTVLHYSDYSHRFTIYGASGEFRVQHTKLDHGFLLDETTHMAMLLADYIDTYPDAIIKVDDADVKWLDNGEHRNVNQYHFRKFIKPRLINFDDNHTVLPS